MAETIKNQGEGDRESARRYNADTRRTAAQLSDEQLRGTEALTETQERELKRAEEKGRSRSKGEDPMVSRNR
ncbi:MULTISPECIES: hypothetical protein [Gammaproteobacteria]|jgi:hypothetical protein|uniref:Uncharacterized protein n=1 Tax=Candidatus Macondimonas diazotrophica TaxID=2305248 RepID=A0A4Z0FEV9_9GAMM|nr:hypothetical protein [Candidatus Macondimonas diazotrophica]TFZ84230.1 hypothetical protein E4680_01485 [Candidatus Macondimonas diazotrophica]HCZ49300.1 hypothetical protein [Gammaproteobacteria bacterium]MCH78738.1 hypothetical protein [Gammaproteobacteria bacterium]